MRALIEICKEDYPTRYPNIFREIMNYINSNDKAMIYSGLKGLYALCSRYENEIDEDR